MAHSATAPDTEPTTDVDDDGEDSDFNRDAHFSSGNNEWATPTQLMRQLAAAIDGIDLDPCSGAEDHTFAEHTLTAEDDGLSHPWHGVSYANPPYDAMPAWMEKAHDEATVADGPELVIVLIPARTSTDWFHDYVTEADRIGMLNGRLKFNDFDEGAPFPSALVVYDGTSGEESAIPEDLEELMARRGQVYEPVDVLDDGEQASFDDLFDVEAPTRGDTAPSGPTAGGAGAGGQSSGLSVLTGSSVGDGLALELADQMMRYPEGVEAEPTVTVVSDRLTAEGEVREVLTVADGGPDGSTAEETYYLLSHPVGAPENAACTVCAGGASGWQDVHLLGVERAEPVAPARRAVGLGA